MDRRPDDFRRQPQRRPGNDPRTASYQRPMNRHSDSGRPANRRPDSARPANRRPEPARPANRRPTAGRPADNRRQAASYRQQPSRRPANRRPRRRFRIQPPFIIICLIVLAILVYVLSAAFTALANNGTYCDNITINGISITKYGKDDGAAYIANAFSDRLNKSYTLYYNDKTWTFTPADFGANLEIGTAMERAWNLGHVGSIFDRKKDISNLKTNPIDIQIAITYDEKLIENFVEEMYNALYIEPINATVTVAVDQPYLTGDSYDGQELDREATLGMIETLIEDGEGSTMLPILTLEPGISSDKLAQGLEIIVEYSTDVTFRGYNSRYNVRKGLNFFNGMCVSPGETINFNDVVGDRTEARGWKEATEYAGRNTTKGFGGGICQASTTLYGAVLKAGMDIIERHPHSQTVSYVEPSLDAAVFYGSDDHSKNMIFRNNTDNPIYIYTEVTKETATVTIYGVRPEYRYELYSNIISQDSEAVHIDYVYDTEGTNVYYATDSPKLYSKGHAACSSEGWLISYDWDTNDEVTRKQLCNDVYSSGVDLYWVGIHNEDGSIISKKNS